MPILPFAPLPDPAVGRQRDRDRRHPERETLELAAAGAAQVLGPDHDVTMAFAKAAITMDKADLWHVVGTLQCGRQGRGFPGHPRVNRGCEA